MKDGALLRKVIIDELRAIEYRRRTELLDPNLWDVADKVACQIERAFKVEQKNLEDTNP